MLASTPSQHLESQNPTRGNPTRFIQEVNRSREVLGLDVVYRSGHRRDLVARVYWQSVGGKTMVRLYRQALAHK